MSNVTLTLLGKPDCHLCDDARIVVTEVVAQLGDEASVTIEEKSILDDPELNERHWDEIPVVFINGTVHTIWRVDPVRLRKVLTEATVEVAP